MAVCGCGFCGYQIRYHGMPEGKYPVEHIFCTIENWRKLETENLTADWLEMVEVREKGKGKWERGKVLGTSS